MSFTNLLKQRCTIDRRGTGGTDDYAQKYTDVPCYKRDNAGNARGDEVLDGRTGTGKALADTLFDMQVSTDIKVGDRLRMDSQRFDIVAVDDVAADHHKLVYGKWVAKR